MISPGLNENDVKISTVRRGSQTPAILSVAILIAFAAGCAQTRGPNLVINSHLDYNKAVSQVLKEELLLNVVRRRYMEAPQFLNVSSISTNFETTASIGAAGSFDDIGDADIFSSSVDAGVTFSDSPTVTITPLQGEAIARQLHEPLSPSTVVDLVKSGYSLDGALRHARRGRQQPARNGSAVRRLSFRHSGVDRNDGADPKVLR